MAKESSNKIHRNTIRYMTGVKVDKDNDKFPQYETTTVCTSHVKQYDDVLPITFNLSVRSRNLIEFITREMNSEGIIRNDVHTKTAFRKKTKLWTDGRLEYTDATINQSFSELKDANLLIPKGKGLFRVNPEYFYRNSDVRRLDSIKEEYTIKHNKQNKTTDNDNT